jgi:zinc-ribbon domain
MVSGGADTGQAALEKKAAGILAAAPDDRKTVTEVFGGMQDWVLEMGPYRLLLIPVNREWWFWDPIHNDWQYTGYHAGEIIFSLNGQNIELKMTEKTPAGSAAPPSGTGQRFCQQCGAQLKTGLKFCSNCGTKIS